MALNLRNNFCTFLCFTILLPEGRTLLRMSTVVENDEKDSKEKVLNEPIFVLDATADEPLDEKKVLFSIYNEIQPDKKKTKQDEEWSLRMTSVQEWFIRCSWINKFLFLELLCQATEGCNVLKNVLQSIESIFSKDVLESLSGDSTNYCYDRIPIDDNRALDVKELNKEMKKDYYWFLKLNPSGQTRIILKLLRLGGGGLAFRIYNLAARIYKERQGKYSLSSSLPSSLLKYRENSKQKVMKNPQPKISTQIESRSEKSTLKEFAQKKLKQLERREEELSKYKKLKELLVEDKIVKKGETKETVDCLQILPIRLNRRIMSYIDDKTLSGFKKVGKYWVKMIDESINEKSGRKAMNAKINKIIGIKADREEKKNEEKSEKEEVEFITELGAKDLINKKNENEKTLIALSKSYEEIFSRKYQILSLNSSFYPERCGVYDKVTGILACSTININIMVHFYSIKTGARFNFIVFGMESPVTCLALHKNRTHIFLGCRDGSLISKDIRTNETTTSFNGHTKAILSIFTTSSNLLSASADNTIKYFQLWSGLCLLCINLSSEFNISSALLAHNQSPWTAIGTLEGYLVVVNMQFKKFLAKVKLHTEEIKQLANDNDILVTGSSGGKIRVWNVNHLGDHFSTLKPYYNINAGSSISSLKLYKNQIFSGCGNGTVKIISLATGKIFKILKISSQTPIKGLDITEDKLFMKLIIWHEKGIEIRSFSLQKLSLKKMSMEEDNQESEQKAPKKTRRNEMSRMILCGYVKNSQKLIETMPNAYKRTVYSGNKMPLNLRCCTASSVRNELGKYVESKSDVFARPFNANHFISNWENSLLAKSNY